MTLYVIVMDIQLRIPILWKFIPKCTKLTLRVHYEPLNSNRSEKCECFMEYLLFSYKRLCTVTLGIRYGEITNIHDLNVAFQTVFFCIFQITRIYK